MRDNNRLLDFAFFLEDGSPIDDQPVERFLGRALSATT